MVRRCKYDIIAGKIIVATCFHINHFLLLAFRVFRFSRPRVTKLLDLIACFVSVVTLYKQKQYGAWEYRTGHNQLPPASVCMCVIRYGTVRTYKCLASGTREKLIRMDSAVTVGVMPDGDAA